MDQSPPPLPTISERISSGAGFGIRALARIIDIFYGIALGFGGGMLGGIVLVILARAGEIDPGWQERLKARNMIDFVFGLLAAFAYHSLTEGICGASLGKLICRLRVVREDGGTIGLWQAIVRSLAYYVDALFFGLIAYSSMRQSDLNQRYGDRWAHTIVVRSADAPNSARKGVEIVVLALLVGSACSICLMALAVILHAR